MNNPPTQARLKECLDYDEVTGLFTWKRKTNRRVKIGGNAGSYNTHLGYVSIGFDGHKIYAHRLAWLYVHGEMPPAQIDHINGIGADNRIANLRPATQAENKYNRRPRKFAAGLKGTHRVGNRWVGSIQKNGQRFHLGCFATTEEAHAAYVEKANELFGQFARAR